MHDDAPLSDADITARIRTGLRCLLPCREDRRPAGTLCWSHHDELGRILDPTYHGERDLDRAASIPILYARLDPTPATTGAAVRRNPGFASTPPLNLDAVVMRDPRSVGYPVVERWYDPHPSGYGDDHHSPHEEDDTPPRAVHKAITGLAEMVYDDVAITLPSGIRTSFANVAALTRHADDPHGVRDVAGWCRWLHLQLDHLTGRDDADEVYRDLTELHDQLRPAAGDPKPRPSAHCTGWVRDPDGAKVECKAPLYEPPPDPGVEHGVARPALADANRIVIRCSRCDRPYTLMMLLRQRVGEQRSAA